jgi:hypothetical protein
MRVFGGGGVLGTFRPCISAEADRYRAPYLPHGVCLTRIILSLATTQFPFQLSPLSQPAALDWKKCQAQIIFAPLSPGIPCLALPTLFAFCSLIVCWVRTDAFHTELRTFCKPLSKGGDDEEILSFIPGRVMNIQLFCQETWGLMLMIFGLIQNVLERVGIDLFSLRLQKQTHCIPTENVRSGHS